jgi:hypothetical protein
VQQIPKSLLGLIASVALASCGGGGGGNGSVAGNSPAAAPAAASGPAASPSSTASPSAAAPVAGSPAAPGTPVSTAFTAFGPTTVASGLAGAGRGAPAPVVARLAGGGSVVAWTNNGAANAQVLDANGNLSGSVISFGTGGSASIAVAGLANGDWVIAWDAVTLPAVTPTAQRDTVQFRRYGAAGALVQDTAVIGTPVYSVSEGMRAAATPDGGFAITFAARDVIGSPGHIFTQRYGAAGQPLGPLVTVSARPGEQQRPELAVLPDSSIMLAWVQSFGTASFYMRQIDASGVPAGQEMQVGPSLPVGVASFAATGLPDSRIALAWVPGDSGSASSAQLNWQVVDVAGVALSSIGSVTVSGSNGALQRVAMTARPLGDGFNVVAQTLEGAPRGEAQHLLLHVIGSDGALQSSAALATALVSSVSDVSGNVTGPATPGFGVAGGPDGHFVYAWENASGVGTAGVSAAGQ